MIGQTDSKEFGKYGGSETLLGTQYQINWRQKNLQFPGVLQELPRAADPGTSLVGYVAGVVCGEKLANGVINLQKTEIGNY